MSNGNGGNGSRFWVFVGKLTGLGYLMSLIMTVYYAIKYRVALEDSLYFWLEKRHKKRESKKNEKENKYDDYNVGREG